MVPNFQVRGSNALFWPPLNKSESEIDRGGGTMKLRVVVILLVLSSSMLGADYKYSGSNWMALGHGLDPTHPDAKFALCIDEKLLDNPHVDDPAPVKTSLFKTDLIKHVSDFYTAYDLDLGLSASSSFAKGDAHFSFSDAEALHEDSLSWFFTSEIDYGTESIFPQDLESRAKNLATKANSKHDPQTIKLFYNRCGTEVVVQQRRKIKIVATFTAHHLSTSQKSSLSQSFSAEEGGGASPGKVSFSESFKKFVNNASSVSRVSVSVFTIGAKGIEKLQSGLILANDDLASVETAMSNYLSGLLTCGEDSKGGQANTGPTKCDPRHSAPAVEFATMDFKALGGPETNAKLLVHPTLQEVLNAYYDYSDRYSRYGEITRNQNGGYSYLTAPQMKQFQDLYGATGTYVVALRDAGLACLSRPDCKLPTSAAPPFVPWPLPPEPNCTYWDNGKCGRCTFQTAWNGEYHVARHDYTCSYMQPNTTVYGRFSGPFKVVTNWDNKVWNAWITVELRPKGGDDSQANSDCHGCHGLNTDGVDGKTWKTLNIGFDPLLLTKTSATGASTWTLTLNHCQTGPSGAYGNPNVQCAPDSGAKLVVETIRTLNNLGSQMYYQLQ